MNKETVMTERNKVEETPLDPVAESILATLRGLPADKSIPPDDIARQIADSRRKPKDGRDLYKRYRQAVKEQVIFLARQGQVEMLRRGEPVDPNDFKGLWRVRLKR